MHDPFPFAPPERLVPYVQSVADRLGLQTLPLHFHEIMVAFTLYHVTNKYISPAFSRFFFPKIYPTFNARTKLNWDVHIVSFVQSVLICGMALWVMKEDKELAGMNREERVHGYTGASGLIQAFAGGYFLWDLVITVQNVRIFGIGMLFHAIGALCVFSFGFRPFVNHYAPTFILYELSSPFLNIHWFCDKLNMTGSTIQFVNGVVLLFTFFSCRLVWGTYHSARVYVDVWHAMKVGPFHNLNPDFGKLSDGTTVGNAGFGHDVLQFAEGQTVPLWLTGAYLASNLVLNGLNWYWFGQMIKTIRKRFDPPFGTRKPEEKVTDQIPEDEKVLIEGIHVSTPAALEKEAGEYIGANVEAVKKSGTHLEVNSDSVRSRTRRKA